MNSFNDELDVEMTFIYLHRGCFDAAAVDGGDAQGSVGLR